MGAVPARREVRVSDAQREECALMLRDHYAAGRLTAEELEERTARAQVATTWTQLRSLTRDLPRRGRGRGLERAHRVAVRAHAAGYAATNASVLGAWALADSEAFWPAWVIGPTTAALAFHVLAGRELLRRRQR